MEFEKNLEGIREPEIKSSKQELGSLLGWVIDESLELQKLETGLSSSTLFAAGEEGSWFLP